MSELASGRSPSSTEDEIRIAPTPRTVPGAVRGRLLFGGTALQMGWGFLGLGILFSWLFVGDSELWTPLVFSGQTASAEGQVIHIEETNSSENEARIYAIGYAFELNGETFQGTSYTFSPSFDLGETVSIELVASDPTVSRIEGLRYRKLSAFVGIMLLFPLVGLGMVVYGTRRGLRNIHVLAHGRPALGRLVNKRKTSVKINEQPVYELTYAFRDHTGRERQSSIRTLHTAPVEDEAQERLLYNPSAPQHIVLLDDLGRDVSVDARGYFVARRSSVPVLILPALASAVVLALVAQSL